MPVSWQIGPTSSMAMSTLDKIISRACEDWVPGVSLSAAIAIAARTSGGRFVDVWVISSSKLPARNSIGISKVALRFQGLNETMMHQTDYYVFPSERDAAFEADPRCERGICRLHRFTESVNLLLECLPIAPFGPKPELRE